MVSLCTSMPTKRVGCSMDPSPVPEAPRQTIRRDPRSSTHRDDGSPLQAGYGHEVFYDPHVQEPLYSTRSPCILLLSSGFDPCVPRAVWILFMQFSYFGLGPISASPFRISGLCFELSSTTQAL